MSPYHKDDPTTICALFGNIAERYDSTNAVLSLGLHWHWNRRLVKEAMPRPLDGPFLDLCCGTGEIAWTYLRNIDKRQECYLIDFCPAMLEKAERRGRALALTERHSLTFKEGDAQAIPLSTASIAAATVAYGIRNVQSPTLCLKELWRVLTPGGSLAILELTRPKQRLLKWGHAQYLRYILPVLGRLCTSDFAAYSYLSGSIDSFVEPAVLLAAMEEIGFIETRALPLCGGIAHLLLAKR